jgi:hypothetical protein
MLRQAGMYVATYRPGHSAAEMLFDEVLVSVLVTYLPV